MPAQHGSTYERYNGEYNVVLASGDSLPEKTGKATHHYSNVKYCVGG